MNEREKEIAAKLNHAMDVLDEVSQAFIAGVANGMELEKCRSAAAMAERKEGRTTAAENGE